MIDPRALKMFLAVCRANSISGGARLLNISQPSVSNAIAQLEQSLGASLFQSGGVAGCADMRFTARCRQTFLSLSFGIAGALGVGALVMAGRATDALYIER